MNHFDRLTGIMARLRGEGGCPWDRKQTHKTLKPYLLEETYEVLDAIDQEDDQELKKELGDLLLQVVFHAQIAHEDDRFNVDEVSEAIVSKLIHRHLHVFGNEKVEGTEEVLVNWEQLKKSEGDAEPSEVSVLDVKSLKGRSEVKRPGKARKRRMTRDKRVLHRLRFHRRRSRGRLSGMHRGKSARGSSVTLKYRPA